MAGPVSPLAPAAFPALPEIAGLRFASLAAGVRYANRTDVMLAELAEGSAVAGVFTRSSTRSAPVRDCEAKIGAGTSRAAFLVNSGNSNAFTGAAGERSVAEICAAVAQVTGIDADRVFTSSTGVIGEPLPHERIVAKLGELNAALDPSGIEGAARAIMTTDTFPKGATETIEIDGREVKIAGIAKGSGMIAPDMATMLVYIFTDAKHDQPALQSLLREITDRTFNCITVDSDTSTSDTLLMAATGASGVEVTAEDTAFATALEDVFRDLAQQVVRDGEGATKFITLQVNEACTRQEALDVAFTVAHSPLVKTALYASDANWGRILAAVGRAPVASFDVSRVVIDLGDVRLVENGGRANSYTEAAGSAVMAEEEITIRINLGRGDEAATVWTSDLSHDYVSINADYRS